MPRPTLLPEWATSGANIVEPTPAKKASGWLSGERPPAQIWNWWKRLTYDWVKYLDESVTYNQLAGRQAALVDAMGARREIASTVYNGGLLRILPGGSSVGSTPPQYILLGATNRIAVSTNYGRTFADAAGVPTGEWGIFVPAAAGNAFFAATVSGTSKLFWNQENALLTAGVIQTPTPPATNVSYKAGASWSATNCAFIGNAAVHFCTGTILTWAAGTQPSPWTSNRAIAAKSGMYVMVDGGAKRIATSPTGLTWTQQTPPAADAVTAYLDLVWSDALQMFVALGDLGSGNKAIHVSANGTLWTSLATFSAIYADRLVATPWGLLLFGSSTQNEVWSSVDGKTWTPCTDPLGLYGLSTTLKLFLGSSFPAAQGGGGLLVITNTPNAVHLIGPIR